MTAGRTVTTTRAYARPDSQSAKLWERAQGVLPGGNSRKWRQGHPRRPRARAARSPTSTVAGAGGVVLLPTAEEIGRVALIVERMASVDRCVSPTPASEAVMMAVKAARGLPGRSKIANGHGVLIAPAGLGSP